MAAMPYIASQSGAPLLCHIEYEKSWKAVPMFWAFHHKITCGLVSKLPLAVPNIWGRQLNKPVVGLQVISFQGIISHEGHASHS